MGSGAILGRNGVISGQFQAPENDISNIFGK
jgi:hypothetical protein